MKPGTRCECRDESCGASEHDGLSMDKRCAQDAVRLVTVREPVAAGERFKAFDAPVAKTAHIPPCAACAEYHEARQASESR